MIFNEIFCTIEFHNIYERCLARCLNYGCSWIYLEHLAKIIYIVTYFLLNAVEFAECFVSYCPSLPSQTQNYLNCLC